jgi:hypothetical protein
MITDTFRERANGFVEMHVGIRDMNLTRNFVTCPDHHPVLDELWTGDVTIRNWGHPVEPDNGKGVENCVVLHMPGSLMDTKCLSVYRYICQIINV